MDTIQEQINNELFKFQHEAYNGDIPEDILERFIEGVFSLPSQVHGMSARKIKSIYERKVEELTNGELQEIIKVIFNVPLEKSADILGVKGALEKQIRFEDFVTKYHHSVDEFQKKLQMKKATLQSLSHGGGNGMKILRN
jgi:hypothetical protein